jgi:hypothetical protein
MKKKLLALFAACSMITTVSAGLVQTAYAADPNVRIEVADGSSDSEKILRLYYEGIEEDVLDMEGKLSFTGGAVTIKNYTRTIGDSGSVNKTTGKILWASDDGVSYTDGYFATATITIPTDVDITVKFQVQVLEDANYYDYADDIGTVSTVIPKKASEPEGPSVTVDEQAALNGTKEFAAQSAKVYAVQIAANNFTVTGADVSVGGQKKSISFSTEISGSGTAAFAVILANDNTPTNDLPEFSADNVTPITKPVD